MLDDRGARANPSTRRATRRRRRRRPVVVVVVVVENDDDDNDDASISRSRKLRFLLSGMGCKISKNSFYHQNPQIQKEMVFRVTGSRL